MPRLLPVEVFYMFQTFSEKMLLLVKICIFLWKTGNYYFLIGFKA